MQGRTTSRAARVVKVSETRRMSKSPAPGQARSSTPAVKVLPPAQLGALPDPSPGVRDSRETRPALPRLSRQRALALATASANRSSGPCSPLSPQTHASPCRGRACFCLSRACSSRCQAMPFADVRNKAPLVVPDDCELVAAHEKCHCAVLALSLCLAVALAALNYMTSSCTRTTAGGETLAATASVPSAAAATLARERVGAPA